MLAVVAGAFTLLAEAMIAVAVSRSWHVSWWEWHVLMLIAFGAIAYSARREEGEERFSDLYLDQTAAGKREVSVMFADLEGFTSFSGGRDPREVSEMLNTYRRVGIPPIVREHGGEIDRLIGDAIMATWGTRGDQPDHAARAVRAALAVQRETSRIAEEHPGWPRFRAAVNTGEAGGARHAGAGARGDAGQGPRRACGGVSRGGLRQLFRTGLTAMVMRDDASRRSSSSVKRTSQTHVVRPRWIGVASACTNPSVAGLKKVVEFDCPTAKLPSPSTARCVVADTSDSPKAAYAPPCTRPSGCWTRCSTGKRPRQRSGLASSSSKPSRSSSVPGAG